MFLDCQQSIPARQGKGETREKGGLPFVNRTPKAEQGINGGGFAFGRKGKDYILWKEDGEGVLHRRKASYCFWFPAAIKKGGMKKKETTGGMGSLQISHSEDRVSWVIYVLSKTPQGENISGNMVGISRLVRR